MQPPDDYDLSPADTAIAVVIAVAVAAGVLATLLHAGERFLEELRAAVQG